MVWGVATLSPNLDQKFTDLNLGTWDILGKINPRSEEGPG